LSSSTIRCRSWLVVLVATLSLGAVPVAPALAASQRGEQTLHIGMQGTAVRVLQQDLTKAGFRTQADGIFGAITLSHVIAFQRRFDLRPNGTVGQRMFAKLKEVVVTKSILTGSSPGTAVTGAVSPFGTIATTSTGKSTSKTTTTSPGTTSSSGKSSSGSGATATGTGGSSSVAGPNNAPVERADLQSDGLVVPPSDAPQVVREVIAGADLIAFDPYIYGGGHASFISTGYDCSGSVSFALHAAGLLSSPLDSTEFETWGKAGPGRWITIWANGGHAYMEIAGLWFDTGAQSSSNGNDRWSPSRISPANGFVERHPSGW